MCPSKLNGTAKGSVCGNPRDVIPKRKGGWETSKLIWPQ